ncbi:serine hydrolase domain-containing protein [Pararhodobacter sp. SW119]|uniref:serine hydrolase domain-containing protein n=1 Tax=Pararhodobacter sp. SW119 TaxID=2780075 RepID=UPI001ADECEDA|nr:serine hydrolase domain-containing protein [Pararhodobacter sp. SW119]
MFFERFAGAVLGLGITLGAPAQAQMSDHATGLAARIDGLAAGFMATEQVPGAIAAIVMEYEVILRGYGSSDLEAGTPTSAGGARFEIGSITKLFTWTAVMMLVEEGRLNLHENVAGYLPGFTVPGTEPLTLAQLMSHRPGYEDSYDIFDQTIAALPRPQALAASAPEQVFPRGTVTSYSNWGVALVGLVVEEVAGQRWEDVVQAHILDPLGMADTTTSEAARSPDQPPLSRSYRLQGGMAHPAFRIDIGAFAPAGSIASTAADMARFTRFLMGDGSFDGARLLQPETMTQMRTRLFDDHPQAPDMAHGFQSRAIVGATALGHGGGLNEFLSNLVFIPEIGAGVFISQNGGTGASLPFLGPDLILAPLIAEAGLEATAPRPVPDAAERAAEAAGRYLNNRRSFSGPTQVLAALSPFTIAALPDGAVLAPAPRLQAMVRYEPVAPDLWEDTLGDRLALIRDADDRVLRLADGTGAHTYERVTWRTDPVVFLGGFGMAALLALTTLLGLIWRRGLRGGSRMGQLAAGVAVAGAGSVWAMAGAGIAAAVTAAELGSEFVFDQPQPTLTAFLALGDVVAVMAGLVLLSLVVVWRAPGWSIWRRLHQSVFALALAGFAALMVLWGLAFGGYV